jgi:hypothetical protein
VCDVVSGAAEIHDSGEHKMTKSMDFQAGPDMRGELRIWQAVIVKAIQDWLSGTVRAKRQAEQYLFDDNIDFPLVCRSAEISPDSLRKRLAKLRNQGIPENCSRAA